MKKSRQSWNRSFRWTLLTVFCVAFAALAQDADVNFGSLSKQINSIRGVPSKPSMKQGIRNVSHASKKRQKKQYAQTSRRKTYSKKVRKQYDYAVVTWRQENTYSSIKQAQAIKHRQEAQRIATLKAQEARKAKIRIAAVQAAKAKKEAIRIAALKEQQAKKAAQQLILAQREEKKQQEAAKKPRARIRQNLTFAFVNPRREPVAGLQLVAHVQTPVTGEKTVGDLTTDENGHIRLADLELPATVDFDVVAPKATDTASSQTSQVEALTNQPEWDFANVEDATLLVEKPLGNGRMARVSQPNHYTRLASTRLISDAEPQRFAAELRRPKIYDGNPKPIVMERNVADLEIAAPAGSSLTTPVLEDQTIAVPESGKVALRLPLDALSEGVIPIRVALDLPGGESEAVIDDYPTDPYQTNSVAAPPLRLVRLSKLDQAGRLGVMGTRADLVRALGDLKGKENKKNQLGKIEEMPDGSEWWIYPNAGTGFKLRSAPGAKEKDKNATMLIERVRIFSEKGGELGGVHFGSTPEEMIASLGAPQVENDSKTPSDALSPVGQIDTWIDGGLRICHNDTGVLWLETVRPDPLLLAGTTAFVPRTKARLFVESFRGHSKTNLVDVADLKGFLRQMNSITLVDSRDEADLVLKARVTEFYEDKDSITNLIPYRYDCRTTLAYSLYDTNENRFVVEDKEAVGTAKADYVKEAAAVGIGGAVLLKKGGLLGDILGGVLIGGGIAELHKAMQKAANRCPAISARTAFNTMVSDIDQASDFSVRVTDIDYARGTLQINAGSKQGLRVSQPGAPVEFQVEVAGAELPHEETAKGADYYTARVISVSDNSSVCQMFHVTRRVKKLKERFNEEAAPEVLRQLPEAATGMVSARAWVQFPEVTVISDADIRRAEAAEEKE